MELGPLKIYAIKVVILAGISKKGIHVNSIMIKIAAMGLFNAAPRNAEIPNNTNSCGFWG